MRAVFEINRIANRLATFKTARVPSVSRVGRTLLARPFPANATRRILLAYVDDQLAYTQFNALLRYERRFAARGIHFRAIPHTALRADRLPAKLDALFLQSVYVPPAGALEAQLAAIRQARPDLRIAYFDWFAPTDIRLAARVEPWVDAYVKKSLLRDRARYLQPTAGHTNLTDYYGARFGTDNPPPTWTIPPAIVDRLTVGPSFSTGQALIGLFEAAETPPDGDRPIDLHARIATKGSPWYSAMRQEAATAVDTHFGDLTVARQGLIPKKLYMREMEQSKICFSPFGYGEICWRDFEAIAAGAVLLKPDMSHIESVPDIYLPFETYLPVRWDLADIDERVRAALADPAGMRRMAERAFAVVRDHLRGEALFDLVDRLSTAPQRRA
jgi:hypothetical protein